MSMCPPAEGECKQAVCNEGVCAFANVDGPCAGGAGTCEEASCVFAEGKCTNSDLSGCPEPANDCQRAVCNNGDCGVGNKEFDSPCGTGPFQSCCPDVNGNGWECCENTCASAFGQQACVEICFSSTEAERCREPDADPQCQVGRCNSGNTACAEPENLDRSDCIGSEFGDVGVCKGGQCLSSVDHDLCRGGQSSECSLQGISACEINVCVKKVCERDVVLFNDGPCTGDGFDPGQQCCEGECCDACCNKKCCKSGFCGLGSTCIPFAF